MRARILLAGALLAAALPASSATSLRGGLTLSRLFVDPSSDEENFSFSPGVHVSLEHAVPAPFGAWTVGAGFEQRGGSSEASIEDEGGSLSYESNLRTGYLIFPVGVRFENALQTGPRPYFAVRLVPSILLSARGEVEYTIDFFGEEEHVHEEFDAKDDLHAFDLLGEGEVGLSLPLAGTTSRFLVGAGLGYGFLDAAKESAEEEEEEEEEPSDYTAHNLVLSLKIGFTF